MIQTSHLFPILQAKLVELLGSLKDDQWNQPSLCKAWSVKDIAAHMLDAQIRRLSIGRDNYHSPRTSKPEEGYDNLLTYLNELNRTWVEAAARISPKLLMQFHELIGPQYSEYHASLDPMAPATFPVAWAGEQQSLNWMDTARDYTEQWLHQQQIREALKKETLLTEELFRPVLDAWILALPHAYSTMPRPNGTALEIVISGKVGGTWYLAKWDDHWELIDTWDIPPTAKVKVDARDAWKVLAKNYRGEEARALLTVRGDEELAYHFADVAAVMA